MPLPRRLRIALFVACVAAAACACGGETAAPSCESLTESASCSAQPSCVWLYNTWSRSGTGASPPEASLHPACFDTARTGPRAVCSADELRVTFFSGECWERPCTTDDRISDAIAVCWAKNRP